MDSTSSTVPTSGPTSPGTLYTTQEVATMLKVAQRTVQFWIRTRRLPAIRYGHLLRVRQADLASFGEVLHDHTTAAADHGPSPAPPGMAQE
jgi:excisionase family DNA binding protein